MTSRPLILLPLVLLGCATPVVRFPHFAEQKKAMGKTAILADAILIDDSMRDTNFVDLPETRGITSSVLDSIRNGMHAKGFDVAEPLLASMGLVMQRREAFKVIAMEAERDLPFEELATRLPPLFVSGEFLADDTRLKSLASVLRALVFLAPEDRAEHLVIQDANMLGTSLGVTSMVVLMMGGYNMAPTKQYTEGAVSTRETVGPVAVHRVSQLTLEFYVIDVASGELLWHDRAYSKGGTVNRDKALHLASELLDRLP